MKQIYIDDSGSDGPIGFLSGELKFICAGTEIHREPRKCRELVEQLGNEKGIWFWLEGEEVPMPFYAVPKLELTAHDGLGGYLARGTDDRWFWISQEKRCFLLPEVARITDFSENWREKAEPTAEIRLYASRAAAELEIEIWNVPKWEEIPEWLRKLEGKT